MTWITVLLTALLLGAIIYWLLIVSEGVYLGSRVVIALYNHSAREYDQIKGVMPHQDAIHLARPLLKALQATEGKKVLDTATLVLDVATGTARLPISLLRQFDFDGRVVGLDLSAPMLRVAQTRLQARKSTVAWVLDTAVRLPFADGSFSAVTCIEALELLPDPNQALAEMTRVLRPGGCLMITNRVGVDGFFYPGRSFRPQTLESRLRKLGHADITTRRWQTHYDLIDARKGPANRP
jgi:ubiquinone/menaquinone biosynthesis C-methylase UbiE